MTTRTAAPAKADMKAAAELDAMADVLACGVTDEDRSVLGDLLFGQASGSDAAALKLRQRAAQLRGDENARCM